MPEDLTLNGLRVFDDYRLERDSTATAITRMRFFLGKHGPFEHVFNHKPERHEIDAEIANRRRTLEGLV
jgi:hypothetical protein